MTVSKKIIIESKFRAFVRSDQMRYKNEYSGAAWQIAIED